LNSRTNFHGYINDPKKIKALFCDNTILISTSVIETLGLHVLEAIKNGVVTITPNENYAQEVYGKQRYSYNLFDMNSLSKTILNIISDQDTVKDAISAQQKYVIENEMSKFDNIIDVFNEVLNV
jgi:glycosyltransferase involved in cell wall biosynthesis